MKHKKIFKNYPYIIAEISANHNGKLKNIFKLIDTAKKNGADAVKIQTYTPHMMTLKKNSEQFKIRSGEWKGYNLWSLYEKGQTKIEWHKKIFNYAKKKNILIFSTPFSIEAVDILQNLKCPAYKIASFEMNDLNLVKYIAKTKKPMVISTGLANLKEIETTVKIAKKFGCKDLTLLYCVSNYPSDTSDFNLNIINILKNKFKCRVGLSDHSLGSKVAEYSLICGAEVFEKHIALANQKKGLDLSFSIKGKKLKDYCDTLRKLSALINNRKFSRTKNEMENKIFRRSIYTIKKINKGEKFSEINIKTFRPAIGLSASEFLTILGKKSPVTIEKDEPLPKNLKSLL